MKKKRNLNIRAETLNLVEEKVRNILKFIVTEKNIGTGPPYYRH